jgi:heme-degrading monooxygenase HmoA
MILEVAEIAIAPGREAAFEAGVAQAGPLFHAAKGCHGLQLQRGLEEPSRYFLVVRWDSVEDHMVFRESPAFPRWRELVGPHFAGTPKVQHVRVVFDNDSPPGGVSP